MGFQTGTIRIHGKVGNLVFTKTANGDEVRTNSSLNAERLKTDPVFIRTRENWTEFSDAVKAGRLIRNTFAIHSKNITDAQSHSRMLKHCMRTVKSDYTSERGKRRLTNGDFSHLIGYELTVKTLSRLSKPCLKSTSTAPPDLPSSFSRHSTPKFTSHRYPDQPISNSLPPPPNLIGAPERQSPIIQLLPKSRSAITSSRHKPSALPFPQDLPKPSSSHWQSLSIRK